MQELYEATREVKRQAIVISWLVLPLFPLCFIMGCATRVNNAQVVQPSTLPQVR